MGKTNGIKPIIYTTEPNMSINEYQIDAYTMAIEELFYLDNPTVKKSMNKADTKLANYIKLNKIQPVWIYYPWKNLYVKTVPEEYYYRLRTARNRNIITKEEQTNYRNMHVGIIGLSIGSAIVSSIAYTGGSKNIKIADFDKIELTNLNRMVANITELGQNKAIVAARRFYEIDPYADVSVFDQGIDENSLDTFINSPKIDVLIDAMDTLPLKVKARFLCRARGIPVLMATSNGDSNLLDVERYDLNRDIDIFNGRIGTVKIDDFRSLDYTQWLNLAIKIVGYNDLTNRMKESLKEIGKTLPSVPQLATTVNLGAASIVYALRMIANKSKLESGRYVMNLDSKNVLK